MPQLLTLASPSQGRAGEGVRKQKGLSGSLEEKGAGQVFCGGGGAGLPACHHPLPFLETLSCHEAWPWCRDHLPRPARIQARTRQLCVWGVGFLLLIRGQTPRALR